MQSLLDPQGNYAKSEKNVKKYLSSISDLEIKGFYENIELTPFPILLAKEYHKRFSKKKHDDPKKTKNKSKPNNSDKKKPKRKSREDIPFRHGKGIKFSKLRGEIDGM